MTATIAQGSQQDLPAISTVRTLAEDRAAGEAGTRADLVRIAGGSEVWLALAARDLLEAEGMATRVVSMPCRELFSQQEQADRDEVLPPESRARPAVEAASPFGWREWVGDAGEVAGAERFGASAPGEEVLEHYGFTADNVAKRARALLGRLGRGGQGPPADLPAERRRAQGV